MRRTLFVLTLVITAAVASTAQASQVITTHDGTNFSLGVNGKGEAMLTYTEDGRVRHVLVSGAINASAPTTAKPQVRFDLGYDGGYSQEFTNNETAKAALANLRSLQDQMAKAVAAKNNAQRYALAPKIQAAYAVLAKLRDDASNYWKTFTCPKYDGPDLVELEVACKAPDGSYWAVQSWPRQLPDYGVTPTGTQAANEVHLAHWTGDIAQLEVNVDWAYNGRWHHFWGTYTYQGHGVYGFKSTSHGAPLDTYGRVLYVDTFNSVYGPGWQRENSFLMHRPLGSWCYSVNPHGSHPAGTGTQYRFTIEGPGVTPDVGTTANAPAGPYNKAAQAEDNAALAALNDPLCRPH